MSDPDVCTRCWGDPDCICAALFADNDRTQDEGRMPWQAGRRPR